MAVKQKKVGVVPDAVSVLRGGERQKASNIGVARIAIELEGNPGAGKHIKDYLALVGGLAKSLESGTSAGDLAVLRSSPEDRLDGAEAERHLFHRLHILMKNAGIRYGEPENEFLSEAVRTKLWDCDNSSFLVFDVLGAVTRIDIKLVDVPEHMVVATDNLFFETTNGECWPLSSLPNFYPQFHLADKPMEIRAFAFYSRGASHRVRGDYKDAIGDFTKAIKENPNFVRAYNDRAVCHMNIGEDYDSVISDCTKIIEELDPKYARAYYNRGEAYKKKGELQKAKDDIKRALELDPGSAKAQRLMFILNSGRSELDLALDWIHSLP